jgi:uncharacterized protein YegP (UPF0339 family)
MEAAVGDDSSREHESDAQQQALQQSVQSPDRSYVFDDSHDLWPVPPLASASFPEVPPPSIEHASPASAVLAQHGVQHTKSTSVQTVHNGGVKQVVVNGWWSQRPLKQQQQQHTTATNSEIAATPRHAGRVRVSTAASKTAAVVANAASVVANDLAASWHTNRQQKQQQQHHIAVQSVTIQPGVAAQTANAVNKSVDSDLQGATLIELCTRDKAKLAKLMQELSTSQSEVIAQGQRLDRLRAQNSEIISEMADTKSKFNQAIELLKKYQSRNSALQHECTTAAQAKDAVQTKCDSVTSELQQLRDSSSESMTHLQQRIAVLHKELRASETRCETAQEQHAKQLAEHKRKAEHSLSLCASEKSTLQQQLADAKAKQLHTEELLAKSDKENAAVRAELSELKAQLAAFQAADAQREHQAMQSIQMLQQTVTALQLEVTAIRTKQQLEVSQTGPHEGSSDLWLRNSHSSIGNSSSINHQQQQQQQQQHYDDNALRSSLNSSIAQQRGSSIASERSHALQQAANDSRSYEHQRHQQQQQQQLNSVRSSYDYANSSLLDLVNEMEYSDDISTSTTNDTTLLHNTSSSTTDQYNNNTGYSSSMRQRAPIASTIQHQQQQLQQQRQYQRANVTDDFDTKSVRSSYSLNSHTTATALHDVDNNVNSNSRSSNSNKAVSGSSRGHTFFESMLS